MWARVRTMRCACSIIYHTMIKTSLDHSRHFGTYAGSNKIIFEPINADALGFNPTYTLIWQLMLKLSTGYVSRIYAELMTRHKLTAYTLDLDVK